VGSRFARKGGWMDGCEILRDLIVCTSALAAESGLQFVIGIQGVVLS